MKVRNKIGESFDAFKLANDRNSWPSWFLSKMTSGLIVESPSSGLFVKWKPLMIEPILWDSWVLWSEEHDTIQIVSPSVFEAHYAPQLAPEVSAVTSQPASVLQEAEQLINGERRQSYGEVCESFSRIASVWSAVLKHPVTAQQVALCMIGLKLCRESNRPFRDNRVDIAGYTGLLDRLSEPKPK